MSWLEWEGSLPAIFDDGSDPLVLMHIGHPDSVDDLRLSLAAELRVSGVAATFGDAHRCAENAVLLYGWFGYIEDDPQPEWCNGMGHTREGNEVDRTLPAVFTVVAKAV